MAARTKRQSATRGDNSDREDLCSLLFNLKLVTCAPRFLEDRKPEPNEDWGSLRFLGDNFAVLPEVQWSAVHLGCLAGGLGCPLQGGFYLSGKTLCN